jgi:hypothetical protein
MVHDIATAMANAHEVLAVAASANEFGVLQAGAECPGREFAQDARILTTTRAILLRSAFFASTRLKPSTSGNSGISASLDSEVQRPAHSFS